MAVMRRCNRLGRIGHRCYHSTPLLLVSPPPRPSSDTTGDGNDEKPLKPPTALAGRLRGQWSELRQHGRVLSVMASTSVMMSGHGVLTPVMPLFAEQLGATVAQLGMSLSAFAVARLLLNVPLGILSDQYGRRLLLVVALAIQSVDAFDLLLRALYEQLARSDQRFALCSRFVAP